MSRRRPLLRFAGLLLCVLPGLAAACALPVPDGPHAVGLQRFELVDASRHGVSGEAADVPRTLPALAWYPAARSGDRRPYLSPGEARVQLPALARNLGYPQDATRAVGDCLAAGAGEGIAASPPDGFPLLLLSHGFFLYAAQNTALAESLASHGYVVVALAHPGDSVDVGLSDGRIVPTQQGTETPAMNAWRQAFHAAPTHAERTTLLDGYAQALAGGWLGASQATWRDDVLFAVQALQSGAVPAALAPLLAVTDTRRFAIAGMSFGGSTAASACHRLPACQAAISLDGLNFDPDLYDAALDRPMLMLLGDWIRFPMYDGTPVDAGYNPNDYAYERWSRVGLDPRIVRARVPGTRHMAFSDLPMLMQGIDRQALFGDADPVATARGIADVTRAFLDQYLQGAPGRTAAAIEAAGFEPHDPVRTRAWAQAHPARPSP